MKDHWIGRIVALLAAIAVVSLGLTAAFSSAREREDGVRIVTSFYPVYIAALCVTEGIEGVEVVNMVEDQTGCLHDYQMSPSDRADLDSADVLVINGAGAEPFLEAPIAAAKALTVIDLSAGQALLESGHVHTHEHEHEHDDAADVNSHLWVSPLRYRSQIETLYTALAAADPSRAAQYTANGRAYIEEIDAVWTRMQAAVAPFRKMPTLLFHDSLSYLAEDLNLQVAAALNVGEESGVSAGALAEATDVLSGAAEAMLLYDAQYDEIQYAYLQALPERAICLSVDTAVSGPPTADAWLTAMQALCEMWEAAV